MVSAPQIALRALHEALVAARNVGIEHPTQIRDIVDTLECVPLWIADPDRDRTDDVVSLFAHLGADYEDCRLAAATAARLKRG